MGQLLEWPEVVTEGNSLDDCRTSLIDAAHEMALAYRELGKEIPALHQLLQTLLRLFRLGGTFSTGTSL